MKSNVQAINGSTQTGKSPAQSPKKSSVAIATPDSTPVSALAGRFPSLKKFIPTRSKLYGKIEKDKIEK